MIDTFGLPLPDDAKLVLRAYGLKPKEDEDEPLPNTPVDLLSDCTDDDF